MHQSDRKRLHIVNRQLRGDRGYRPGVEVRLDDGSSMIGHVAVLAVGHEERQVRGNELAVRAGSIKPTPRSTPMRK